MGPSREGSRREVDTQKSSSGKFLDNLGFSLLDSWMVRSFHGPMKAGKRSIFARAYNGPSWFLEISGDLNPVLPGAMYPPPVHPFATAFTPLLVLPPVIFP